MYIPPAPKNFSMCLVNFKTIYMTITFATIALKILILSYWARIDNMVVKEPAPAINGNTTGKKLLSFGPSVLLLNISISNIISNAMTKIIKEPATANDDMSTLNKAKKASPT